MTTQAKNMLKAVIEAIEAITESKAEIDAIAEQISEGMFTVGEGMQEVVIGVSLALELARDIYLGMSSRTIPNRPITKAEVTDYDTAVKYGIQRMRALEVEDSMTA